jgi:CRP-like cAMP-binding protein
MALDQVSTGMLPRSPGRDRSRHEQLSTDRLMSRLEIRGALPPDCAAGLHRALAAMSRHFAPRDRLFAPGHAIDGIHVVRSGVACRYALLGNGRRQITGFLLPGDVCDATAAMFGEIDHFVAAATAAETAFIPRAALLDLLGRFPQVRQTLWFTAQAQAAVCRRWMLNLGRRSALERIAHLLCEMFTRMNEVGLVSGKACRWSVTQNDLADAAALTPIHVNRTLMELRRRNLATLRRQVLSIPDFAALAAVCEFDPAYLHACRTGISTITGAEPTEEIVSRAKAS